MKKVKRNIDMLFLIALIILLYDVITGLLPALKITYLLGLSSLQASRKDKLIIYALQIIILLATYFIITNSLFKTLISKRKYYKKNFKNFKGMKTNFLKIKKSSTPAHIILPVVNWLLRHLEENYSTDFLVSAYMQRWIENGAVLHNNEYYASFLLTFVLVPSFESKTEEDLFYFLKSLAGDEGKLKMADIKNISQTNEEKLIAILEYSYKDALSALETENALTSKKNSKDIEEFFLNENGISIAEKAFSYRSFLQGKLDQNIELTGEEKAWSMAFGTEKQQLLSINSLLNDSIIKL